MSINKMNRLKPIQQSSFLPWRKLLAAISIISVVGFFTWPTNRQQEVIKHDTIKEHTNTAVNLSGERTANVRPEFQDNLNNALQTRIAQSYCQIRQCKIINCSSIPVGVDPGKYATNFIESHFKVDCPTTKSIKLIIDNCKFPSNKLQENWLQTDLLIEELTLEASSLIEIDDNAFSLTIFQDTTKLFLISNKITSLTKSAFRHFTSLQELTIRNNVIKQAEYNLLENLADSLTILELNGVINNVNLLRNITGGSVPLKVQILSIIGNSISVIDRSIFAAVPEVQSLYVDRSKVQTISADAFDPLATTILLITLSNNNIMSLPEGLFNFAFNSNRNFHTNLENNPWHCNCNLKWLQEIIMTYPTIVTTIPICRTPKENAMKSFNKADFCSHSEPDISTTTETSEQTTRTNDVTEKPETSENIITLSCKIADKFMQVRHSNRRLLSMDFQVRSRFRGFSASEMENRSVEVKIPRIKERNTLLWFDSNDIENSINCVKNAKRSCLIENLEPQTIYTICLLEDVGNTVSPLNCLSLRTSPLRQARTWLTNEDKTVVFPLLSVSFVFLSLASALFTFLLVRKHPTLLRGSKRVMVVKRRNVDAIILPKGVQIDERDETRNETVSLFPSKVHEDGYVTPLPPAPMPIRSELRASRVSLQSDGNSYVSGVEPTVVQLASWRLRRLKSELGSQESNAPPLPPHRETIPSLSLAVDSKKDERSEYSACTV